MVANVAVAQMFGGNGGHFVRFFDNLDDYRRYLRDRGGVGGILGHILDKREFDMFLSLLLVLICLNVVGLHLASAPVTSCAILLVVGLHFEKYILGQDNTFIHANNFHNYSFHAQSIVRAGQWYRLLTAPFLHTGRKLHLYLNMTALSALCWVEATSYLTRSQYLLFFVSLVATSGVMHILAVQKYNRSDMTSYTAGFSGVVFALKAFSNTYRADRGVMELPLVGSMYSYSLPVQVPSFAQHFVELFLVTILFQGDSNFYANAGGIAAGYVFVALDMTFHVFGMRHPNARNAPSYDNYEYNFGRRTTNSVSLGANIKSVVDNIAPYTLENGVTLALLFVITILSYQLMFRDPPQAQAAVPPAHPVPREVDTSPRDSISGEGLYSQDDENKREQTNTTAADVAAAAAGSTGTVDDDSILSDDPFDSNAKIPACEDAHSVEDDGKDIFPPDEFMRALQTVSTSKERLSTIIRTLNTIILIVNDATTKGQKEGKEFDQYRQIRVSNLQIQECNIVGAFNLLSTLGFVVKEDLYGDKHFVYPRQKTPYWITVAIDAMRDNLNKIKVRAARDRFLREQEKRNKKASKSDRPRGYAAGMGGGNSDSVFYKGGT
jgi:membrane associated rhomboid family serine protease